MNHGETIRALPNMNVSGCSSIRRGFSEGNTKRSVTASVTKALETHSKESSMSGGTPKTFKQEVDEYFTKKHKQLEQTASKIIKKYNRNLEANNVVSAAYLYILEKEPEIKDFSRRFSKSIEQTIYSFEHRFINSSIMWTNSPLIREANKFINSTVNIDDEQAESIDYQKSTSYENNMYSEGFIKEFHESLNKLDSICFQAYYFDGADNAKELAERFDISISSAYTTINKLKRLLKNYIAKHKVE